MTDATEGDRGELRRSDDGPEALSGNADELAESSSERIIGKFMAVQRSSGPSYHPIFEKFDNEHVSKFLDHMHEGDMRELSRRNSNRWFYFAALVAGIALFIFLTITILPQNEDAFFDILKFGGSFAAGVAGGYGWKAHRDSKRS